MVGWHWMDSGAWLGMGLTMLLWAVATIVVIWIVVRGLMALDLPAAGPARGCRALRTADGWPAGRPPARAGRLTERRRVDDLEHLGRRLDTLERRLAAGEPPQSVIPPLAMEVQ